MCNILASLQILTEKSLEKYLYDLSLFNSSRIDRLEYEVNYNRNKGKQIFKQKRSKKMVNIHNNVEIVQIHWIKMLNWRDT